MHGGGTSPQTVCVFNQFREYNLTLKPSKCSLFKEEINYLAHWVSKEVVWLSHSNLRAIAECALPQSYIEIWAFLGLVGHYQQFIKGFVHITQPLNGLLSGEGASRKLEWVSLPEDALRAFRALKQACMSTPVLAFADYTKEFLLETDVSKEGLGALLSQRQVDGQYHLVAYGSLALMAHERNYHSTKLELLVLKWAVMEHFKEYLPYQPFLVRTDNNPLTYIMTTPNLDTTGHQWVGALVRFNFQLEYQKGQDNTVADVLSQITTLLSPETMQSILDWVALGAAHRVEGYNPAVVEGDHGIEKVVHVATGQVLVEMHVTDWGKTQRKDPVLNAVLDWLEAWKKTDLKTFLGEHASSEEGQLVWRNHQNFTIHQKALYLCSTPKGKNEDLLLFVVPMVHRVTDLNECHWDAGHQGHDRTLSLLQEHFWWPGMTSQMWQSIRTCTCCLQHEGSLPKAPLHPIMATAPLDLLHVDFTSIETTLEPNQSPRVTNVLVIQDHFMKHVLAYVDPDQTAKTIAKFLYQGYISIFGAFARLLSDRGANFMSSMIDEMCKILGMKLHTMPYHPQTNVFVERLHQPIMQMIGKLGEDKKADWPSHLAEVVHTYNAIHSTVTG